MEDVKVCRICLVMDVKMYDLQSQPLFTYLESFTKSNLLNIVNSPPYACYECVGLMKKYYIFKQKCRRSQDILYGLLDQSGKITPSEIKQIDRDTLCLSSNLRVYAIPQLSIQDVYEGQPIVKQEVSDEGIHTTVEVEVGIKEEEFDFDLQSQGRSLSSDEDDEPLSLHKEKKIKESQEFGMEVPENGEKIEPVALLDVISNPMPIKRKRGRPKKIKVMKKKAYKRSAKSFDDDGYYHEGLRSLEDYITVINLTLEEQIEEINKRKNSSNYLNSPYQCDLCYKGFIDTHAWKHHVSKHSPSAGDIECTVCKFRFKTNRTLQKHASNHERKYACKSCPYVSSNTTQAKQHMGWHKGVTYKCKHCDDIFTVWTSYMSHVRIKHPSEFICGICGYSYISKLGLAMHKSMMHKDIMAKGEKEVENGPYCEDCDVKFISIEAFKRHMVMSTKHTRSTKAINGCRTCGETFKTAEELRLHQRQQHARKRPKNYGKKTAHLTWPSTCEHCPAEISNGREHWTHYRREHPDKVYPLQKDYVCDICGKSFRGNAFLVYHKRTHTEERTYKCDQCDKAFFNRTNLQVHLKTHSDSRPYPCSVCFKAFKCKGALNRHFRSHTGQKPYECEVCGKAFTQSNSRKLHVATVHLKQPAPYVNRKRNKTVEKDPTQTTQFIY